MNVIGHADDIIDLESELTLTRGDVLEVEMKLCTCIEMKRTIIT